MILDLDALESTDDDPFQFKFGGETFTCRSPNELDVRRLDQLLTAAQTNPAVQLEWMLGQEQWAVLDKIEKVFGVQHLQKVTDDWLAHHRLDLGKSGGSSKRSTSIKTL